MNCLSHVIKCIALCVSDLILFGSFPRGDLEHGPGIAAPRKNAEPASC